MKKIFLKILGILFVITVLFVIYNIFTFTLFDDEFKLIKKINLSEKNYSIEIYYIPSNATSQSFIQVRKIDNGVVEVLENFERFNYLNDFKVNNDTLKLIISDTSLVKIKEIKKVKLP